MLKKLLKKFVFGLDIPQQFVCVALEKMQQPMSITFTTRDSSKCFDLPHVLLGYKPVLIAIRENQAQKIPEFLCMNFHLKVFKINSTTKGFFTDRNAIARLLLRRVSGFENILMYEAFRGQHSFINSFQQWNNNFRNNFAKARDGNVNLPGNLHDQVRVAYAVPRVVALVSVSNGGLMNLFPTDLHGQIDNTHYLSSLRIGGKAEEQVLENKNIVISEVESSEYDIVYSLGKNHMQDLKHIARFEVSEDVSEKFQIPLPKHATRYFELTVIDAIDLGIHRVFLYKIVNKVSKTRTTTLAHIHQYYGQWRLNNHIDTEFFIRHQ